MKFKFTSSCFRQTEWADVHRVAAVGAVSARLPLAQDDLQFRRRFLLKLKVRRERQPDRSAEPGHDGQQRQRGQQVGRRQSRADVHPELVRHLSAAAGRATTFERVASEYAAECRQKSSTG